MPPPNMSPIQQELLRRRRSHTLTPSLNVLPSRPAPPPPPPPDPQTLRATLSSPSIPSPYSRAPDDSLIPIRHPPAPDHARSTTGPPLSPAVLSHTRHPRPLLSPAASNFTLPAAPAYGAPVARRKALLIGIGYANHPQLSALPGCRHDVVAMHALLTGPLFRYPVSDVRVLCDELPGVAMPTRLHILRDLNWLTAGLGQGDAAFFFFAGHGDFTVDLSGDEVDSGLDQCIMPVDYAAPPTHGAGDLPRGAPPILDDILYERLVRAVPAGAKVTAVVDACRSGSMCDLPVGYSHDGRVTYRNGASLPPRLKNRSSLSAGGFVLFSGCSDNQLSADMSVTVDDGSEHGRTVNCGIMSRSFVDAVEQMCASRPAGKDCGVEQWSYGQLMDRIRQLVAERAAIVLPEYYERQEPQFSTSHRIDIWSTMFSM